MDGTVFSRPSRSCCWKHRRSQGDDRATARNRSSDFDADNPLSCFATTCQAIRVAKLPELPPFVGGAVGYAGYDTVRYVEKLPNAPPDDRKLPDLSFAFYDHMIVFDNVQKTAIVVVLAKVGSPMKRTRRVLRAALTTPLVAASIDWSKSLSTPIDSLAADGYRNRRRARISIQIQFHASRSLKTRFASASNTFAPATSFRW